MKYINADGTGSPFDLARNFADVLIKAKLIREYQPPKQKARPASFGVGHYTDRKPFIVASCGGCKQTFRFEGQEPKCMKVQHCGLNDLVPADVAAAYLEAHQQWRPKERPAEYESRPARPPRERVTSF